MTRGTAQFVNKYTTLIYKGFYAQLVYVHACLHERRVYVARVKCTQIGIDDKLGGIHIRIDHTLVNKSV